MLNKVTNFGLIIFYIIKHTLEYLYFFFYKIPKEGLPYYFKSWQNFFILVFFSIFFYPFWLGIPLLIYYGANFFAYIYLYILAFSLLLFWLFFMFFLMPQQKDKYIK